MAPCTPVSPPQPFLFSGSSRRVSAPPPAPLRCADDKKRPSLLALSGSPVKCRRRLSFNEELPPEPVELPPALRQLDHQHPPVRHAAWREIAHSLHVSTPHPRLAHAVFQPALDVLNRPNAAEFQTVAALLPNLLVALRASEKPDFTTHHNAIMCAVMDAVSALEHPTPALEHLLKLLRDEQCARILPVQTASRARALLNTALSLLKSPGLEVDLWPLLLYLVALVVDACERARLDSTAFSLSANEVSTVLRCTDTMACRSPDHTITVLDALKVVFTRKEVLPLFVRSDASAVIAEISLLFADNLQIQHRCVDLLACLSSPKLLTALDC